MSPPETKRMPIWGVGPAVGVRTACYGLAALVATLVWPSAFAIRGLPYPWLALLGGLLLAIGVPWYVIAVRTIRKAYHERRLVTDGVYALCRHPIYAGWIFLILPALGLLMNSWLVLSTAVVMYVLTRIYVPREEENLEAQFGEQYVRYKRRTGAIFPALRRRR
jgi:protein-S-isoprenylcysteine O-methyltransferase Ste14